jgi:hypothetical protein
MKRDIPPSLAAQTAFPSGPWRGFYQFFDQLIWDDPKIISSLW